MDIFHNFFYVPIFNLLMFLYQLLGQNLGLAIILIALIAKLVTLPLTRKQLKSAGKNREFQSRMNEVKKKYKNNEEVMSKELAKLQAEFLPGQLGGCLNLIIIIVLLIQVRNVVVNLVNQGVHAFNQVAYSESIKLPEDSVGLELPDDFSYGTHELEYEVSATNGGKFVKKIAFGVAENDTQKTELEKQLNEKTQNLSEEEKAAADKELAEERKSGIALFIEELNHPNPVLVGRDRIIKAFLRPPSKEFIDSESIKVKLDGSEVNKLDINRGSSLNFEFLGADLSKVASDIGFENFGAVFPYLLIAVTVGITQFYSSRIQSSMMTPPPSPKTKSKGKKDKDGKEVANEPDFATMMQQSSKQMMFIFPAITTLMSLGFLGGASIFPTGVSLFWTGQNGFVIIEQLIVNREKVIKQLRERFYEKRSDS